ncbi:MAG TPA: GrpB family protein [Caulobacteraceae bacterium]|nr:GrpB family protein [Caulobacteraceae bacterium]
MPRIEIVEPQARWADEFTEIGSALRRGMGPLARAIHHIGSTAVPGLAAKDNIDVQVSVAGLHPLSPLRAGIEAAGYRIRDDYDVVHDHVPPFADPAPEHWAKRRAAAPVGAKAVRIHIRVEGAFNTRYAQLFRDYLRAAPQAAAAYAQIKRELAARHGDDEDAYYAVKDPVCDLIMDAAELWAASNGWTLPPTDA